MNYTSNYHLPQWEKSDRILMDDFNQMCANIDGSIRDARAEAETARSEAAEAAKLPYAVGTYLGNGDAIKVTVGFRPRFLIITAMEPTLQGNIINYTAFIGTNNFYYMVERLYLIHICRCRRRG